MCTQILSVAVLIRTTHPFGPKKSSAGQPVLTQHEQKQGSSPSAPERRFQGSPQQWQTNASDCESFPGAIKPKLNQPALAATLGLYFISHLLFQVEGVT